MSFILTLILSMFLADLVWWLWAHRTLRSARLRWALGGFMSIQVGCLLLIVFGRIFSDRTDEWLPKVVLSAVFLWHFILLPGAILLMAAHLFGRAASWAIANVNAKSADSEAPAVSRRQFLRVAAVSAPPVATVLATGFSIGQLNGFRVRPFHLRLPQLPPGLDGMTIAHVSDIHVGRFTSGRVLRRIVETTNSLQADLVLLTGDLINHALSDLPAALDVVRAMDSRYGAYMCEGNHDLIESRAGFEQAVRRSGVPILINESAMVKVRGADVQLLGLRWGPGRGDAGVARSMGDLLLQRRPDAFPILLAHHPHAFDIAAQAQIPLTLAGHTHGGQLMASPSAGFGPLMFRYWSGLYEKVEHCKLLVSNGVGNWFPLRVNAPAEILHITLHSSA